MTDDESKATCHYFASQKGSKFSSYFINKGLISDDPALLELLKSGYQAFKEAVVERIYNEHKDELGLNFCSGCLKIARTPKAKQCQFCFYSWHYREDELL